MLEEAKQDLKKIIIAENSEEYYYKLIADRVAKLHQFKEVGDTVFGKDDELFRGEVLKSTVLKNQELDDTKQAYELVMTEIALDVFISN
jgi:hypothetical protein